MVRRRSTVRFRNGAQVDDLIRKNSNGSWMPVGTNGSPQGIFRPAGATSAPQRMKLERDGGGGPRERGCRTDPAFGRLARSAAPGPLPAALLTSYRWPPWISRISGTSPGSTGRRCPSGSLQRACAPVDSVSGERGRRGQQARLPAARAGESPPPAGALTRSRARDDTAGRCHRLRRFRWAASFSRACRPARPSTGGTASGSLPGLASPAGLCPVLTAAVLLARIRRPWRAAALAGCWVWPGQAADHPRVMPGVWVVASWTWRHASCG